MLGLFDDLMIGKARMALDQSSNHPIIQFPGGIA